MIGGDSYGNAGRDGGHMCFGRGEGEGKEEGGGREWGTGDGGRRGKAKREDSDQFRRAPALLGRDLLRGALDLRHFFIFCIPKFRIASDDVQARAKRKKEGRWTPPMERHL